MNVHEKPPATINEMFAVATLIQSFLVQCLLGEDLCSRHSKVINCIPCSDLCPATQRPCNTKYHFCPRQCGYSIEASNCPNVCDDNCLNGTCEYTDGVLGLKCLGCKPEYTGQMCREVCAPNCYECHQYNTTCIKCKGRYRPPDCRDMYETSSMIQRTTNDVRLYNCSSNCSSCNHTSGNCTECSYGYYGSKCEKLCADCNTSRCAVDLRCSKCLGNWFRKGCITARTQSTITTSSWLNCTGQDCQMRPKGAYLIIYVAIPTAVFILAIGIIGLVCWRRRRGNQTIERDVFTVDDHVDERMIPPLPVLVEVSSEDSGPYTFIRVLDRDCVPDHIYQAAMVTGPSVDPHTLSAHICQTSTGTFSQRM